MTVGLLITLALSVSNEHACKSPHLKIWFVDSELQYTIKCPGSATRFETPALATRPRPGHLPAALPTDARGYQVRKPRIPAQ